jgi:DnaK suppressor protein
MDETEARRLLDAERARVQGLLDDSVAATRADRDAAAEQGDMTDAAEPLTAEEVDDAVVESLHDRLAAIARAEQRLADGTFGRSVRSGAVIPDDRLAADPAAELTVEEAKRTE